MPRRALLSLWVLITACEPTTPLPGPTPPALSPSTTPGPPTTPADAPVDADAPTRFAIGGGEAAPETHVAFDAPRDLIAASARVVIDRVAPRGLNFFALQVDFANGTWAHGGVQDVDGPDGARTRQVNWGGLVDRGGGTADYDEMDDVADLARIQNPPAGQHVGAYPWQPGVAYEYRVERGAQITLPPGDYQLIPDRPVVHVARPRTMWAWRFTVRPLVGDGPTYAAVLYDGAATFTSFYLWNESGYGSTDAQQHTSWSTPRYRQAGAAADVAATSWQRF